MLKILIAEDDSAMRIVLRRVIEGIPDTEIVGEATNGNLLVQMVEDLKPDVVFVDIDMPEKNGVEASKEIFDISPSIFIIFATAFDNHTHEAFEVYAFDYLIKPFNLDRIKKTVERIKNLKSLRQSNPLLERPFIKLNNQNSKLMFQINDRSIFVNMSDIILVTRNERKTVIFTTQGIINTYESLQQLEKKLEGGPFYRCHKGFIINKNMVLELAPWGNKTYIVKMANTKETALMTLEKAKEFRKIY